VITSPEWSGIEAHGRRYEVMGTGIVSIALSLDGHETLSWIVLAIAQLAVGRGDHWITGGALAISTLAAGRITAGAKALATLGHGAGALQDLAVGLWVATILWLPVLLLAETLRPRLRYDVRRWSTVFPVGMYAACSFVVGTVAHASAISSFARVWVWVALAVWAVVLLAMIRRAGQILRADGEPNPRGANELTSSNPTAQPTPQLSSSAWSSAAATAASSAAGSALSINGKSSRSSRRT
jgi:hypothetical protein